jgi:type IX secretion system substrate protein/cleaved adhesin domain-containing protein
MKKIVLLFSLFALCTGAIAQDTLLYENFDVDPTASYLPFNSGNDTVWVNFDADGLADANGRPQEWYWSNGGFAAVDTSDGCLLSSSWLQGFLPGNRNWLMTPPLQIVDATAMLYWSAAPRQTPLFMDGYSVLVSTTDNQEASFTDTLFQAGQYLTGNGPDYTQYTFSPGFIHGMDGTYIEFDTDSESFIGVQRPFMESLSAYAGQTIYITFLHDSDDDNLISIDDILVTGTMFTGITENNADIDLSVYPNPAGNYLELSYYLQKTSPISVSIYDISGRLISNINRGLQLLGNQKLTVDVSTLAAGQYTVAIEHVSGRSVTKFIKN